MMLRLSTKAVATLATTRVVAVPAATHFCASPPLTPSPAVWASSAGSWDNLAPAMLTRRL
jgi:hypothetical protein